MKLNVGTKGVIIAWSFVGLGTACGVLVKPFILGLILQLCCLLVGVGFQLLFYRRRDRD